MSVPRPIRQRVSDWTARVWLRLDRPLSQPRASARVPMGPTCWPSMTRRPLISRGFRSRVFDRGRQRSTVFLQMVDFRRFRWTPIYSEILETIGLQVGVCHRFAGCLRSLAGCRSVGFCLIARMASNLLAMASKLIACGILWLFKALCLF